jgi:aerotaxis receptor
MRLNLPVSQQNYDFPGDELLVSSTNTKGEITHCNPAFVRVSGYAYEELIGQPHNLIRHPDMPAPPSRTCGAPSPMAIPGRHWSRTAARTATTTGCAPMSRPSWKAASQRLSVGAYQAFGQVAEAEALYARMRTRKSRPGQLPPAWRGAPSGLMGWWDGRKDVGLVARMAAGHRGLDRHAARYAGLAGRGAWGWRAASLVAGGAFVLWRFQRRCVAGLEEASRFAADVAACNLSTECSQSYSGAVGALMLRLQQIQINLRAVVGDVRTEVRGFAQTAHEIAQAVSIWQGVPSHGHQPAADGGLDGGNFGHRVADGRYGTVHGRCQRREQQVASRSGAAISEVGLAMEHIAAPPPA